MTLMRNLFSATCSIPSVLRPSMPLMHSKPGMEVNRFNLRSHRMVSEAMTAPRTKPHIKPQEAAIKWSVTEVATKPRTATFNRPVTEAETKPRTAPYNWQVTEARTTTKLKTEAEIKPVPRVNILHNLFKEIISSIGRSLLR